MIGKLVRDVALSAVVVTVASGSGGVSTAQAEAVRIPKGFLLYEKKATETGKFSSESSFPIDSEWTVSDKRTMPLTVNPCDTKRHTEGRVAMRTIDHRNSGPGYLTEQLVLYPTPKQAKGAMVRLRSDLALCGKEKPVYGRHFFAYTSRAVSIGDEALHVIRRESFFRQAERIVYDDRRSFVVRRGSALILYMAEPYFPELKQDAIKMSKKVCGLPRVCDRPG
jgi:hypothetical protein